MALLLIKNLMETQKVTLKLTSKDNNIFQLFFLPKHQHQNENENGFFSSMESDL